MTVRFIASAVIAALLLTGAYTAPQPILSGESAAIKATTAPAVTQLTAEEARDIALEHAGLTLEEITNLRVKFDPDTLDPDWDVEFRHGDFEFEYEIHAITGKILEWDKEYDPPKQKPTQPAPVEPTPTEPAPTPTEPAKQLTKEEAEAIALRHASLTAADVTGLHSKLDADERIPHWDVEFRSGDYEYDYEIDAETGKVLEWDKEYEPVKQPEPQPETPAEIDALAIALQHAGLTADQITLMKNKKDFDDGKWVFDVEFRSGDWEYDYEIDAETGKVLEWDKEYEPVKQPEPKPETPAEIDALAIALEHAGLTRDEVKRVKVEKDFDDGRWVYEVEFMQGRMEYEYEIDAETGKILEWDKEYDD